MTLHVEPHEWDRISKTTKLDWIKKSDDEVQRVDADNAKHVVIVGAGMAGLVAAHELSRLGYSVEILEAQHRVGGRVWTLREPFADGLYAEAGAMRVPLPHELTTAYIDKAGLTLEPFENESDNAWYRFFDNPKRHSEYIKNPRCFDFGVHTRREVDGRLQREGDRDNDGLKMPCRPQDIAEGKGHHYTAAALWSDVMEGVKRNPRFYKDGKPIWAELLKAYDHVSTFTFLKEGGAIPPLHTQGREKRKQPKQLFDPWTEEEIYFYGQVEGQQARMNNSVLALIREYFESFTDGNKKYRYVVGGMDQLPRFLAKNLQEKIRFGSWVEEIRVSDDHRLEVHYRTAAQNARLSNEAASENTGETAAKNARSSVKCDHLILAVPFTILRHMKGSLLFSREMQRAIQSLNYSAAGKIFLQCRERFWEHGEKPIYGGHSQTDLPLRSVWYPHHGKETGRGVLLASYTWGRDAERWGHLNEPDRIRRAIEQLDVLHPEAKIIERDIVEIGTSVMWQNQVFTGGAFALFNPQQEHLYQDEIRRVRVIEKHKPGEKKAYIHFAGEHTCLEYHRWIEGAVDSGLRVAWEVNYKHSW